MATTTRDLAQAGDDLTEVVGLTVSSQSGSAKPEDLTVSRSNIASAMRGMVSDLLTPVALVAAMWAPAPPQERRIFRASGATPLGRHWLDVSWDQEWRYEPELISEGQVAALNELLALPLVAELSFQVFEQE